MHVSLPRSRLQVVDFAGAEIIDEARPLMTGPAALSEFAGGLFALSSKTLPRDVVHETRRTFLNVLGTSLGASRSTEIDALIKTGGTLGGAEVSVLGRPERLDRYAAALAIGFAGHFDDFDDTHLETVIHPGAATLGALWPLGLLRSVSPESALLAMALGVESQLRVGLAMSPSHYDLGWHITGTCGVVGAAVAAAIALGANEAQFTEAMALSLTMTVGQREAFGTPIKPFHAGKAAANGLLAAMMAMCGQTAPPELLSASGGYFDALSDAWSNEWLLAEDLGKRWAVLDNTYKPFPCGIVAHPGIEAAIDLHAKVLTEPAIASALGGEASDQKRLADVLEASIDEVTVACNPLVVELMGRPSAATGLEARFCAIHGVASGLLFGRAGLAEFSDEVANDGRVDALRRRTQLRPDAVHSRDAATVVVRLRDGSELTADVKAAAGSRDRPLTDEQLQQKFERLVEPVLSGRAQVIAEAAMALGDGVSIETVDRAVRGA